MTTLPRPERWRDRNILIAFGILLGLASAVAAAVWTVQRIQRAEYLTAAITLGGAIFALCFGLIGVRGQFMPAPLRGNSDSEGIVLLPDPIRVWLACIAFAAAVPSGFLYVIFVPQGVVDLPLSRGQQIFSPILIGMLVFFAASGLIAMARRRGTGHLRLTPYGFELVDIFFTQRGSWDDVCDITDEAEDKQARHPIVFVMKDAKPIVVKNASGYAPGGAALYWMVRHYWRHSNDRSELTDGRALDRLRAEQFDPE
jgi:hypothetical protein